MDFQKPKMSSNDQIAKMAMSLFKLSNEPSTTMDSSAFSIGSMIESSDLTDEQKEQMAKDIIAEMTSGVQSICEKYKKSINDLNN